MKLFFFQENSIFFQGILKTQVYFPAFFVYVFSSVLRLVIRRRDPYARPLGARYPSRNWIFTLHQQGRINEATERRRRRCFREIPFLNERLRTEILLLVKQQLISLESGGKKKQI